MIYYIKNNVLKNSEIDKFYEEDNGNTIKTKSVTIPIEPDRNK